MRKGKKLTSLLSLLITAALLLTLVPGWAVPVSAASQKTLSATCTATVSQGSSGYCYVYIDSLADVASLSVEVFFDPEVIEITKVYNSASCTLYDSATKGSSVQFSYIFDGNGADSKTQLFYFRYKVLSEAEPGKTTFSVMAGEAYDSALQSVAVGNGSCTMIVQKKTAGSCTVSTSGSVSTSMGSEFTLSYTLNTNKISSGSFAIHYDPELFEVVSVSQGSFLSEKLTDINDSLDGTIQVSFVATAYGTTRDVLSVTFRTIANVDESSTIQLTNADLYNLDLENITCSGCSTKATVTYDEALREDLPGMHTHAAYSTSSGFVTVTLTLDADSHLGAGDFTLNFDSQYLTLRSYAKGFSPSFFNVNDKNSANGVVKFSIISLTDITDEATVLTLVFDVADMCETMDLEFTLTGSGLADSLTEAISLNLVGDSISVTLGHDLTHYTAQAPTCTEDGWEAYETCSRCDHSTYVPLPATGHTEGQPVTENEGAHGSCEIAVYCTVCGTELSREYVDAYLPGDINGDGNVNNKDVTRMFQYLSNYEVTVVEVALDVNGDGKINNKDLTRLFQYLSNYDVEIY